MQANDIFYFSNEIESQLFSKLTHELRCTVCPNQNLAESHSEVANQLKNSLYLQIKSGKTEDQIKNELVLHFGDAILYNPPMQWNTLGLWGLPILLLLIGLFFFIKQITIRS
jgi:cytochrome c-type biogenesis protein CcmH/NrfF